MVLETELGGSTLASYVLGGTELLSQTRGGATSYYLHDGQGSTRALSDDSGAATDAYAYTAFGELYAQAGPTTNAYLYTGQQFDSLTGLYSLRARYYDPLVGRFLSRDDFAYNNLSPLELNRYVYTANNPINNIDPTGNQAFVEYQARHQEELAAHPALQSLGETTASSLEGPVYAGRAKWYYQFLSRAESSRTTIAVSRIQLTDGSLQEIVSVNGQAGKDIAAKIAQAAARYGARFVSPASLAEHAEIALYNYAKGSEAFRAIGISNWGGACPACTGFFRTVGDIGLYWIKQFTFGYFP